MYSIPHPDRNGLFCILRLKLSPSPSTQVSVSRMTGSSSSRSKRKRVEAKDFPQVGGEGKLLVSEEATASGAVTISPTDMTGNGVTLTNDAEQVSSHSNSCDASQPLSKQVSFGMHHGVCLCATATWLLWL